MRTILVMAFLLVASFSSRGQQVISATDPSIEYVGRFDFADRQRPAFMYSGCMLRTGFTGTSLTVRLQDDSLRNWYTVKLDDSVFIFKSDRKDGLYELAHALRNTKHSIEISRRTEWHGGTTRVNGFVIDDGSKLFSLPKLKRTIEFVGNSLTCGYGNEGKTREEHFAYETENNYHTYGTLVARAVKANYVAVCRSGIGMYQSYGGEKEFVQPKLYDEIVVGSKSVWDYKSYQPDVVVIELGSNDLAKTLDSAAFVNTYIQFVKKIRSQYADARIICAAGPDGVDEKESKFQSYIRAVTDYFGPGDKRVHYFYFGRIDSHGSDWHPNLKEHEQMAAVLLPFVKKITGW
ncbi:SGNH/GDSL hydrolase family protein [Chryseolinea sp. T2]|uniref:SGNH/GDSL hydrolase family protein n=1 Tax=Chryseolinea sp. T2 TaxID=3129255 RepID=UPI003077DC29